MYRINKWAETFENADTRKRQRLGWFLCPSGNDSAGYLELMSYGPDGVAAFGVFIAICQWSATRGKNQRGEISRNDGRPMSVDLLATTIRVPAEVVAKSLPLLCHPDVGWMSNENTGKTEQTTGAQKTESEKPAGDLPVICQSHPKDSSIVKGEGEGEGEGEASTGETDVSVCVVKTEAAPFRFIASEYIAAFGGTVHITDKRKRAIQTRWKDSWWREHWQRALEVGSQSAFLRGDSGGWKISFDWFLNPDSVAKIIEGNYSGGKPNQQRKTAAEQREELNASGFDWIRQAAAEAAASCSEGSGISDSLGAVVLIEKHGAANSTRI